MKFAADLLIKLAQQGFEGMTHKVIDPFVIQIGQPQTIWEQYCRPGRPISLAALFATAIWVVYRAGFGFQGIARADHAIARRAHRYPNHKYR